MFSTWTKEMEPVRKADIELLDPEAESKGSFEETVREVIRFYAIVLDEAVGQQQGALELLNISHSDDLFSKGAPPPIRVGRSKGIPSNYHRATIRLVGDENARTFMGTFWEARAIVAPPVLSGFNLKHFPYAYVGIDRDVWICIENRKFERLLEVNNAEEKFFEIRTSEAIAGVFYVDRYGILRAWFSEIPMNTTDFHVEGSV